MADYKGEFMQGEVEADTGVLHLRLNRAPVNAVSGQYFFEIGHFFQLAKDDPSVRAIVLSSTLPKYFTAGLDLKEAGSSLNSHPGDVARKAVALRKHVLGQYRLSTQPDYASMQKLTYNDIVDWQDAINQIEQCDKPVIAAVSGIAYGLAIDICCACDIRYATEDVQFSIRVSGSSQAHWCSIQTDTLPHALRK